MPFKKTIFAIALIITASGILKAQENETDFDQTQVITGDRSLTVQQAYKISDIPSIVPIDVKMGELKYQLIPRKPEVTVEVDTIPPAKVKIREPLETIYQGFVKAGAGTFATPYIEAYYASERNRDLSYGVHARHFSNNDGVNRPVAFSGLSQNSLDLWGKKVFGKHSLRSSLKYERDVWYYYGFDPQDAEIDKEDIRQRFNLFELNADWKSYYRDSSKINHDIAFDAYLLNDRYDSRELGFKTTADLRSYRGNQFYQVNTGFDIINYQAGALTPFEFIGDTLNTLLPGHDVTNAILNITPTILLRSKGLTARVGLGLYGRFQNQADFHAFPNLDFSYSLFNDIFIPYASLTGAVQRNSYRTLTDANPWTLSNTNLENTIQRYKLMGGIRGSISDNVSFNVFGYYEKSDNTPLFINDTLFSQENRFSVIYDEVNTLAFGGEVSYMNNKKWSATLRGELFSYNTDNEDEAWHLPAYQFSLKGDYNLFDKFLLGTNISFIGPRQIKSLFAIPDQNPEAGGYYQVELDAYLDLSLSIEYRYTTRLSAFLEGHNLTGTKYDIYYRFPAQRAFILGGVKYSF